MPETAGLIPEALTAIGIALCLGLLVGLQRQRSGHGDRVAGFRTFGLIAMLGAAGGLLIPVCGPWLAGAGLLGVASAAALANLIALRRGVVEGGMTTELAMLVVYVAGVMLGTGMREPAIALAVATAVLLQLKERLHGLAARIGDADIRAIFQFAIITFVVLPILPDRAYGPYDVLNPHRIWLMVVLVVAMSLAGYVALRTLGQRHGTIVAGLIGGLISSTATTAGYSRRARGPGTDPAVARASVAVLVLATMVMYARVLIEIHAAAPSVANGIALPVAIVAVASLLASLGALYHVRAPQADLPPSQNPAALKSALAFALLYAVVLFLIALAERHLGNTGIYAIAALGGLTDMDAITLSTARLAQQGQLEPEHAWRAIIIASIANLVFKGGIAWVLGGRSLAIRVLPWFAGIIGAGAATLALWR